MSKLIGLLFIAAPSLAQAATDQTNPEGSPDSADDQPVMKSGLPPGYDRTLVLRGGILLGSVGTDQMPASSDAFGIEAAVGFRIMPERLPNLLAVVSGRHLRTSEFEPSLTHGEDTPEHSFDLGAAVDYRVAGDPWSRFALHLVGGPHFRSRSSMVLRRHTLGPRAGAHATLSVHPALALEAGGGYLRHLVRDEDDDGWYAFLGSTRGTLDYSSGVVFCRDSEGPHSTIGTAERIWCVCAGYSGETSFFERGQRHVNTVAFGIRYER